MKKNILMRIIITVLLMIMVISGMGLQAFAEDDGKMAINIYSNPDTSKTKKKFDTFMIDFRGVQTPAGTYWALANFSMDLTASKKQYRGISGGGAYAGIQNTGKRVAIMAFWEYKYQGGTILNASRMFPAGKDNGFGGEGEGTNWIGPYLWNDNSWYRMVLHCWIDAETGTTFVGQWYKDEATGKWTLISYFDTKLIDSFFTGSMSQFQENFASSNAEPEREFNYKNMYVLDHVDGKWKSLATSTLSCDYTATNKKGTREFGATDEFFWGKAAGVNLDNQIDYNRTAQKSDKYTIKQPETPTLGEPSIKNVKITNKDNGCRVTWANEDTSTPQLSYKVELLDTDGNVIAAQTATRPEVNKIDFKDLKTDAYTCKVTLTDVFGTDCSATAASEAYISAEKTELQEYLSYIEGKTPTKEWKDDVQAAADKTKNALENGFTEAEVKDIISQNASIRKNAKFVNLTLWYCVGGTVVVAAIAVLAIVLVKRKNKKAVSGESNEQIPKAI